MAQGDRRLGRGRAKAADNHGRHSKKAAECVSQYDKEFALDIRNTHAEKAVLSGLSPSSNDPR